MDDLCKLLRTCTADGDQRLTHVNLTGGRYHIVGKDVGKLWSILGEYHKNSNQSCHISEIRDTNTPITLDFDVKGNEEPLPEILFKSLHLAFVRWAKTGLTPQPDDKDLVGVLLTKPIRKISTDVWKRGFHLHYPKLMFNAYSAKNLIIVPILKPLFKKVWETICPNEPGADDALDSQSCSVPWMLYGACKKEETESYRVSKVWDHIGHVTDIFQAFKDMPIPEGWGVPTTDFIKIAMILSIQTLGREKYLKNYNFLGNNPGKLLMMRKCVSAAVKLDAVRRETRGFTLDLTSIQKLRRLRELTTMLGSEMAEDRQRWLHVGFCLWQQTHGSDSGLQIWMNFSSRSEKYDENECHRIWYNQMRPNHFTEATLVYLAQKHNPTAYNLWVQSKATPTKDIGTNVGMARIIWDYYGHQFVCCSYKNQTWYKFDGLTWIESKQGLDLRRLISAEDGPLRRLFARQLEAATRVLNVMLQSRKRVQHGKDGPEDSGISDDEDQEKLNFAEDKEDINEQWMSELRELSVKQLNALISRLNKNLTNLEMASVKSNVMKECAELFYDSHFADQLDANPYLFAFANGVYDFQEGGLRDGRPEDRLSRRTVTDFITFGPTPIAKQKCDKPRRRAKRESGESVSDYSHRLSCYFEEEEEEQEEEQRFKINKTSTLFNKDCLEFSCDPNHFTGSVAKLLLFFAQVFPDEGTRRFFLRNAAQTFVGGNRDKVCLFWTGSGNNGKTVTQTLFEKMLGSFAIKMSTNVLTGRKPSSGAPNPELARMGQGVRWAVMEEPNADESINAGTLKSLTGNDTFFARDLYCTGKSTQEISPLFKLHVICNSLPSIKDADMATWNRVRVVPFEATFLTPGTVAPPGAMHVFTADPDIISRLERLTAPLAWYLIHCWCWMQNETETYQPPIKVMNATMEYQREHDMYRQFIEAMVRFCDVGVLGIDVMYTAFKDWATINYVHGFTCRSKSQVIKHLELSLGKRGPKGWVNKKLKTDRDDDNDEDN